MLKSIVVFVLLCGIFFSVTTTYTTNYFPIHYFKANIVVAHSFSCDVTKGTVISGTPCASTTTPAYICPNTYLKIKPSTLALWSTDGVLSPYPTFISYVPSTSCSSTGVYSVKWISASIFGSQYTYATKIGNGYSFDSSHISLYGGLSAFNKQCIDYDDESSKQFKDSLGYLLIAGKGDVLTHFGT
ncbi:MAG: hypothetical protein ABID61_05440, partial [Candidatus Micrarchaeota archaeon]